MDKSKVNSPCRRFKYINRVHPCSGEKFRSNILKIDSVVSTKLSPDSSFIELLGRESPFVVIDDGYELEKELRNELLPKLY
jgi:hypothetical protein